MRSHWREVKEQPYRRPMWASDTHWILRYGNRYLLYEIGQRGFGSEHGSLEEAQATADAHRPPDS